MWSSAFEEWMRYMKDIELESLSQYNKFMLLYYKSNICKKKIDKIKMKINKS